MSLSFIRRWGRSAYLDADSLDLTSTETELRRGLIAATTRKLTPTQRGEGKSIESPCTLRTA